MTINYCVLFMPPLVVVDIFVRKALEEEINCNHGDFIMFYTHKLPNHQVENKNSGSRI
jgi:hypothetical protein